MTVKIDSRIPVNIHIGQGPAQQINIEQAKAMRYDIGRTSQFVGHPQPIDLTELQKLGARRHYVRGDGACWARATWQCVLSQVLDDREEFARFVQNIANPKPGYEIPEHLARETIYILHQLKDKFPRERIDYLNHENIDDSLIFFMRHVAGEEARVKNRIWATSEEIHDIKTNKFRYGGPEIRAFRDYFGLELHKIVQPDGQPWIYSQLNRAGQETITPVARLVDREFNAPRNFVFAANNVHYEFISFDPPKPVKVEVDLCASFSLLAHQIDQDHELALKLQREFDEEQKAAERRIAEDARAAERLQAEERAKTVQASLSRVVEQKVKHGGQGGCSGQSNKAQAKRIVEALNARKPSGVRFNPDKLTGSVAGGTCSAMSIKFLDRYSKLKAANRKSALDTIKDVPDKYTRSSREKFRILQAAYNAIEKDPATTADDFEKAKVTALLRHYNLGATSKMGPIQMKDAGAKALFKQQFSALADGAYVIRQNLLNDSEKGEEHGHTMGVIKEGNNVFFYDPNHGVTQFQNDDGSKLFDKLAAVDRQWNVPTLCIYGLERSQHPDPVEAVEKPSAPAPSRPTASLKPAKVKQPKKKSGGFFSVLGNFFKAIARFFRWIFGN